MSRYPVMALFPLIIVVALTTAVVVSGDVPPPKIVDQYLNIDPSTKAISFSPKRHPDTSVCHIFVNFSQNLTGWDRLVLSPERSLLQDGSSAPSAYYYAGFAEGFFTAESIMSSNWSTRASYPMLPRVENFLTENIFQMRVLSGQGTLPGNAVKRFLGLLEGIRDGVNRAIDEQFPDATKWTLLDVWAINAEPDFGYIFAATKPLHPSTGTTTTTTPAPTPTPTDHNVTTATTTSAPAAAMESASVPLAQSAEGGAGDDDNKKADAPPVVPADMTADSSSLEHQQEEHTSLLSSSSNADGLDSSADWSTHCSALVRLTQDDLFFGHTTWCPYHRMLRSFKTYHFETTVTMSGYPGTIASLDSWYVTGNKLGVQETTLVVDNMTILRDGVKPDKMLVFLRVMMANVWATNGEEWTRYFLLENSATYTNSWMVLTMSQVTEADIKNQTLKPGTFWLVEQLTTALSRRADLTDVINKQKHFASFNIPYFSEVYNVTGDKRECDQDGSIFCQHSYARARIFERNYSDVTNLDSMRNLLRYNNWERDPLSKIPNCAGCTPTNSPLLSIASRGDLVPRSASFGNLSNSNVGAISFGAFGAVDAKVTSWRMMMVENTSSVISGPTRSSGLPQFSWESLNATGLRPSSTRHRGQSKSFHFDFTTQSNFALYAASNSWPLTPPGEDPLHKKKIVAIITGSIGGVLVMGGLLAWSFRRTRKGAASSQLLDDGEQKLGVQREHAGEYQQVV